MQAGTIASGTTEMLQRQLSRAMFRGERIRVAEDAEEIRATIDRLVADLGGVAVARAAIVDPSVRSGHAAMVDAIVDSLDPREGHFEGIAAAEVCRGIGRVVLPLPVESMLLRRPSGNPLAILSMNGRWEHGDLFGEWEVETMDGTVRVASPSALIGSKVGPFVNRDAPAVLGAAEPLTPVERALLHVLPSWYVFGALEAALDLATGYATERVAFGAPIASYQGVAFPIADAGAELQGLYELGLHALWSVYESPSTALVDALAFRWATIDVARRVLRSTIQVMGAVGLCDEHDLAIITLALQGRLRLPSDLEASMAALQRAVAASGFDSIFTPV
jgi:acyl-CoA dehydrogenase